MASLSPCSIALLFWNVVPEAIKCAGLVSKFGEIDRNIYTLLKSHGCTGQVSPNYAPIQDLIVNRSEFADYSVSIPRLFRLTPHQINSARLGCLDICRFHSVCPPATQLCLKIDISQDWLSVKHPCFKQSRCTLKVPKNGSLAKCNKIVNRRVNYEMSKVAYSVLQQHLPVGSGLCLCFNRIFMLVNFLGLCATHRRDINSGKGDVWPGIVEDGDMVSTEGCGTVSGEGLGAVSGEDDGSDGIMTDDASWVVSAQGDRTTSAQGRGIVSAQVQSNLAGPAKGRGIVFAHGSGTVSDEVSGTMSAVGGETLATEVLGTMPSHAQGCVTVSAEVWGTMPTQGGGTVANKVHGTTSAEVSVTMSTVGGGTVATKVRGTMPAQGGGTVGGGTMPAQGAGTVANEVRGTVSADGDGTSLSDLYLVTRDCFETLSRDGSSLSFTTETRCDPLVTDLPCGIVPTGTGPAVVTSMEAAGLAATNMATGGSAVTDLTVGMKRKAALEAHQRLAH